MVTDTRRVLTYLNFDIYMTREAEDMYCVSAQSSEGECKESLPFPIDDHMLDTYRLKLEAAIYKSSMRSRRIYSPDEQHIKEFGHFLFKTIFHDSIGRSYSACKKRCDQEKKGLRIRLRIGCPKMASLPWEYLFDPDRNDFISLSVKTPIIRCPEMPQPVQTINVKPPFKILFMMANPRDIDQPQIEFWEERKRIVEATKHLTEAGKIEMKWVAGETARDLQKATWESDWHIFHFIGHGKYDPKIEEGLLVLCDDEGNTSYLEARKLALILEQLSSLGLVFLNCCEGARGSDKDIFSSTAATLIRKNIPAIVAMQYLVSDEAAIEFSRTFYESISNGRAIDTALTDARVAVNLRKIKSLEWGVPVLFMRSSDSLIFDIDQNLLGPANFSTSDDMKKIELPKDKMDNTFSPKEKLKKPFTWADDLSSIEGKIEMTDWFESLISLDGFEENELKHVLKAGENALNANPENVNARRLLAEAHDRLGVIFNKREQLHEAIEYFSSAIEIFSSVDKYYYHRAICYMKNDDLFKAYYDFNEAINLCNIKSEYYWGRGILYGIAARRNMDWASHEKAIVEFNNAIKIDPKASYFKSRSSCYKMLRDFNNALGDIQKAIELNPTCTQYYKELAAIKRNINADKP